VNTPKQGSLTGLHRNTECLKGAHAWCSQSEAAPAPHDGLQSLYRRAHLYLQVFLRVPRAVQRRACRGTELQSTAAEKAAVVTQPAAHATRDRCSSCMVTLFNTILWQDMHSADFFPVTLQSVHETQFVTSLSGLFRSCMQASSQHQGTCRQPQITCMPMSTACASLHGVWSRSCRCTLSKCMSMTNRVSHTCRCTFSCMHQSQASMTAPLIAT
jgi:hypothetical protein